MMRITKTLSALFASRGFFIGVMVFFVIQALWFVFSAIFPMAFDEDFHFGIIQIYAEQISPFLSSHPAGADAYGAVARDPSYLFHYLMSFPYRILAHFTSDLMTQVLVLRFINVLFFVYALFIFRRVLQRVTRSNGFTNIALAIFTLIPIVPQLAAHINYDNLLLVLVAWCCLLVSDINRQYRAGRFEVRSHAWLLGLCLLASIVKYAFLPIFIAIIVFLVYDAYRNFADKRKLPALIAADWRSLRTASKVWLVVLLVLSGGLFFQRFGVNVIQYHTPIPSCEKVITEHQCSNYGPWNRDHLLAQSKGDVDLNPVKYTYHWVKGLWWRLFFAVNSSLRDYANYPPLPFPAKTALALAAVMFITTIVYARRIFSGQPLLVFCGLVVAIYGGLLWIEDFNMYRETGQHVAINGRYLIPVLLLMAAIGWRALQIATKRLPAVRPVLALIVLLCFLQGGGVMTFIMRSDQSWYWQNYVAHRMNEKAQRILDPVIIQGNRQNDGSQP